MPDGMRTSRRSVADTVAIVVITVLAIISVAVLELMGLV
jgi:hypothetical protein